MDQAGFFSSLPTEQNDRPLLFATGPLEYDFHDVDGLLFMLDRSLSGCITMMWSKPMDNRFHGLVLLNGEEVNNCVLRSMAQMNGMWILGIPLRGRITEYGKEYALHVEGYRDTDGNIMDPQDFTIHSVDRVMPDPSFTAHEQVALEAAREGIVLLRNERHTLPLREGTVLNLFGSGVYAFRTGAVGAGKINPRYTVDFLEAVRESKVFSLNEELLSFYQSGLDKIPDDQILTNAKALSGTAVLFISRPSGENMDLSTGRGEYILTEDEECLLRKLSSEFQRLILVLNTGYPIDVSWIERYRVDAVLYPGYAGMLAGKALLDVFSGEVNPSAKLPDTWALHYQDLPASKNFYNCADQPRLDAECPLYLDTVYEEDLYVGYRYFETFGGKPAFPFGFGLSYTQFLLEATDILYQNETLSLNAFVKNMGDVPGKEVVQVYVGKPSVPLETPEKELVYFEKTRLLKAGEIQEVRVSVPASRLAVYDEKQAAWILEPGEYRVYVGNSSTAPRWGNFNIPNEIIMKKVKNRMTPSCLLTRLSRENPEGTWPTGLHSGVQPGKKSFWPYEKRGEYIPDFHAASREERITYPDVQQGKASVESLVMQLTGEELARLSVCASAGWGMEGIGEAGSIYQVDGLNLPVFRVADGNSGVNLKKRNIGMPSGVTLCASWNKQLIEEVGKVIGEEAAELGIPLILAPALNIHRNPLNGRQPEYFSEDPYLAGTMAGLYSRGLESTGVGSCMKHLIANNCESSRKRNQSVISERAIREIYFRAFEYAMEIHMPASVMTAYNAVNGVPTAADADLIQGLLREETGFDGVVMTDWTTYDTVDIPSMIQAGNCWITPGSLDSTYVRPIVDGLLAGTIDIRRLRDNVARLIKMIIRFSKEEGKQ